MGVLDQEIPSNVVLAGWVPPLPPKALGGWERLSLLTWACHPFSPPVAPPSYPPLVQVFMLLTHCIPV